MNIYKNKSHFFSNGGGGGGAPVLDPPLGNIHVHIAYFITKNKGWEESERNHSKGWGGFNKNSKRLKNNPKPATVQSKGWGGFNNNSKQGVGWI